MECNYLKGTQSGFDFPCRRLQLMQAALAAKIDFRLIPLFNCARILVECHLNLLHFSIQSKIYFNFQYL